MLVLYCTWYNRCLFLETMYRIRISQAPSTGLLMPLRVKARPLPVARMRQSIVYKGVDAALNNGYITALRRNSATFAVPSTPEYIISHNSGQQG